MITEALKTILGAELATQIETALKGKGKEGKDVDLVIGNDGTFVPADKFDTLKSEKAASDKLAKDTADQLTALKAAGDPAQLTADLKTAQDRLKDLQKGHELEVAGIRKSNLINMKILDKVFDPADVIGQIDLSKIVLTDSGEIASGLDDQITAVKAKKPHWFKPDSEGSAGGIPPQQGRPAAQTNPWKKDTFNLTEQGRILRDTPDLAATLMGQAGAKL